MISRENIPDICTATETRKKRVGNSDQQEGKVGKNAYHLDNYLKTDQDYERLLKHRVDFIEDVNEKKA